MSSVFGGSNWYVVPIHDGVSSLFVNWFRCFTSFYNATDKIYRIIGRVPKPWKKVEKENHEPAQQMLLDDLAAG